MIRRLVEELDATEKAYKWTEIARNAPTKPLTDDEKKHIWLDIWFENKNATVLDIFNHIEKAILRKVQEK